MWPLTVWQRIRLAVLRPLRRAAGLLGLEGVVLLAVEAQQEDADVAEVSAGDGEAFTVGAEGRDAAALPVLGGDEPFLAGGEVADEGLVVLDEDDRLAVGGPVPLRALGDDLRARAVAIHQPDFGKAAAQRGIEDLLAIRRETRVGVGAFALGELLRVLAARRACSRFSCCRCDR